jgi:hypothetical protein
MGRFNYFINGALLGAGALYFLDPQLGRRRRVLLEDQFRRFGCRASEGLDAALRDLNNRALGTAAELQHFVSPEHVTDEVLRERIRSLAGRYVSNASALQVDVSDGCVCLSGRVLADEAGPLIHAVRGARGVRHVDNQLEGHESPGNISSLQGAGRRTGELPELLQANWAPGTRLIAGAAGTLMMLNCMINRGVGSILWGTLGFALATRAMVNPSSPESRRFPRGRNREESAPGGSSSGGSQAGRGQQQHAGQATPWPPSGSALAPARETGGGLAGERMSSCNEDRPDVWPQSRVSPAQQIGQSSPITDQ